MLMFWHLTPPKFIVTHTHICIYGWKAPGATSLLWICHKNVFTLGPLLNSRKLQNAWVFFCLFNLGRWIDYIQLDRLKGVPKK